MYLTHALRHETFTAACEAGVSEHTLEYVFGKSFPVWEEAVQGAVRGGHMHVLRWMTGREDGRGPWRADFDGALEVAATHGHLEVVQWLLERSIDTRALRKMGETSAGYIETSWLYRHNASNALKLAVQHGHFEVLKLIYGSRTRMYKPFYSPMSRAVANGHLDIAQWLYNVKGEHCSLEAINDAARNGYLEVLKWLDANHLPHRQQMQAVALSEITCCCAAENGHLDVVQWLHRAHHECDSGQAIDIAGSKGHLELADWLYENVFRKCQFPYTYILTRAGTGAAEAGRLDVLKWIYERFPSTFSYSEMDAAANSGNMEVITWLHENRNEGCSKLAPYLAAENGHLEVLKWLYTHYPNKFQPGSAYILDRTAKNGHLEVVRWLHENRPELLLTAHDAMFDAALNGHLDIFMYVLEHRIQGVSSRRMHSVQYLQVKCHFGPNEQHNRQPNPNPATEDQLKKLQTVFEQQPAYLQRCLACLAEVACENGNIAILDWVNQFGIELLSIEPIQRAVSYGGVKILQWFYENGFELTDSTLLELAVENRQLEVVRWLSYHGYDVNSLGLVKIAANNMLNGHMHRNVPVLRWLVENGPPLDLTTAKMVVLEYRHIEFAWGLPEDSRRQIVVEALNNDDREVLWWTLVRTQFQDESIRRIIRDTIQQCSKATLQWLKQDMSSVGACRWCFST